MNLERNIQAYIKQNGISQKQLCIKTGITENALSLALNGKRKLSAGEYVSLCRALCVPYDRFTSGWSPEQTILF